MLITISKTTGYVTDIGSGYYKLIDRWTRNALDCYDMTDGANVYASTYDDSDEQKWELVKPP